MKKIDLHIHTIKTSSDSQFTFSLENFKKYVQEHEIDAVAITNHDIFDKDQYITIKDYLHPTKVFPGIEINLANGHILLITDEVNLEDFNLKSKKVTHKISLHHCISFEELKEIYVNLNDYLIIPHYEKDPSISGETLELLMPFIEAGEVNSPKKFIKNHRDSSRLTPVLFSDIRIRNDRDIFPTRQTYVDCSDITINSLKYAFRHRKVQLSKDHGNKLWQIFPDGQKISTGLNIIIGSRASGKTHTLNKINETVKRVKYIKQFSLVQGNEETDFNTSIESKRGIFSDNYLSALKPTIEEIIKIDLEHNINKVENYCSSLIKSATEKDLKDIFSKCKLFDEVAFPRNDLENLSSLIHNIENIIDNQEFEEAIERHVGKSKLKLLILDLIEIFHQKKLTETLKIITNEIVKEIREQLSLQTSATQIDDVDLYQILLDDEKVKKFDEIINHLKTEQIIRTESFREFKINIKRRPFKNASDAKTLIKGKFSLVESFNQYKYPYKYVKSICSIHNFDISEIYKLFVAISYEILNKDGNPISGGERSEFRLLEEISDAQKYDMLLIDEPESSFDNIFLNRQVNQLIKSIAKTMPVIISTHNNTVGSSIGADYVLYTSKERKENGEIEYRIYSGHTSDKNLISPDGKSIGSYEAILNSLEAGFEAYEERRKNYEAIKN